jgi:Flp pilus assembly protein TadG
MRTDRLSRAADEHGAVLVHAAVAMMGLMAFSALVIDYGCLWVSRAQAQNAADAAALAGAGSLAWDDPDDVARAKADAVSAGTANLVWGAAPSILATDITLITCPPGAPGPPDTCVRANVYRSAARANALPTYFAQLAGIGSQDVRATATAQVLTGNAADCMRPWSVADKWAEHWENGKASSAPWTPTSNFDKYVKQGGKMVLDPSITSPDVYIPPTSTSPGTGFTPFDSHGQPTSDYGLELTLKISQAANSISSGWFLAVDLPLADGSMSTGGNDYRNNISGCNGKAIAIGDTIPVETGNMIGPTKQGVDDLVAKDPGAAWDQTSKSITGSCAPGICPDGQFHARSPRIVPIPLFNVDSFFDGSPNGKTTVTITNIMGFFVEGMGGTGNKDVLGRLVEVPGVTTGGGVTSTASFLRKVILVR